MNLELEQCEQGSEILHEDARVFEEAEQDEVRKQPEDEDGFLKPPAVVAKNQFSSSVVEERRSDEGSLRDEREGEGVDHQHAGPI